MEASSMKAPTFAKFLGLKTAQGVYDILHGKTKTLSSDMLFKIMSCFPNISQDWLMSGEGEMFRPSVSQTSTGDNTTQVCGDGNNVASCSATLDKALDEISEMRKALCEAIRVNQDALKTNQDALKMNQENTSRLLGILENMSGKQESDR